MGKMIPGMNFVYSDDGLNIIGLINPDGSIFSMGYNALIKNTAGTINSLNQTVSVEPPSDSTLQYNFKKSEITYNSANNISSGGWLSASLKVVNTTGTGTIDKIAADVSQVNCLGGNVTAALCYEAEVSSIGLSTLIGNFVGFFFPNLSGVSNISNVQNLWSFACDHYASKSRNAGRWLKTVNPLGDSSVLQEFAAHRPGHIAGRYYFGIGARGANAPQALVAGVQYFIPFCVPERATYTKIGLRVTSAVVSSNMRLGIFHAEGGAPTKLVYDSGNVTTDTTGAKEVVMDTPLEAGVYFLCVFPSDAISVNFLEFPMREIAGSTTDDGWESTLAAGPTTYGALPAIVSGVAAFPTSDAAPAVWMRT